MKLIDVRSAIAGAGLVAIVFGLSGMMQAPTHIPPLQIEGIPSPDDLVSVSAGPLQFSGTHVVYSVPAGKRLIVTRWQANLSDAAKLALAEDLSGTITTKLASAFVEGTSEYGPPTGLAFEAGSQVLLLDVGTSGLPSVSYALLGYLTDA